MKIAYLTNCFGIQSHTFIRREIVELRKLDLDVSLFGIRREPSDKLSVQELALVEQTDYLYPLNPVRMVCLNFYWALRHPGRYWTTLWKVLAQNGERKFFRRMKLLYHFFIASCHAKSMERGNVEHIHAHFLNVSSTIGMYASLLTGIPYSVTVHSAGTRNAPHIIGIAMKLRHAQFLIMISHYNIRYFDAIYPCKSKSTVVRCGMDLEQYPFTDPDSRAEPQAVDAAIKLVAVGRMVEKKGFGYLIEATRLLVAQGRKPQVEILGAGPLQSRLREMTDSAGLNDCISFPGPASSEHVRARMLAADIVVVPSVTSASGEQEGIPVVLMEAMALGVPVVSTEHSGIPELVRNGETGVVVEEKNAAALASAVAYLIDHEVERAQWVRRARELIESEFNIAVIAGQRRELFLSGRSSIRAFQPVEV